MMVALLMVLKGFCMPLGKPKKHVFSNLKACAKHIAQTLVTDCSYLKQFVDCSHVATLA